MMPPILVAKDDVLAAVARLRQLGNRRSLQYLEQA